MGLEAASYISQLNPANPVGGVDHYATADDHLRLLKQVLKTQFPNLGAAAVNPTAAELNFIVGVTSSVQTQLNAREALANKNVANGYAGLNASAQLANAQVSAANVTQHQGSIAIAGSQVTSGTIPAARHGSGTPTINSYLRGNETWGGVAAGDLDSGTLLNARVAASNVTQHQAALSIAGSQMTGSLPNGVVTSANVTQHQAALAIACSQLTGNMPDARIVASNVTQHQTSITAVGAAATIGGNQIGTVDVPIVTGSWARGKCRVESAGVTLNTSDMAAGYTFSFYNDSASNVTITQGAGVTLRVAGTGTTGNKVVAQRGLVSIWCRSGTEAILMGAG